MIERLTCEKCGKFLMEQYGSVVGILYCTERKCKHPNKVKKIYTPDHDIRVKFIKSEEAS